jgi:hypothetical protein
LCGCPFPAKAPVSYSLIIVMLVRWVVVFMICSLNFPRRELAPPTLDQGAEAALKSHRTARLFAVTRARRCASANRQSGFSVRTQPV